MNHSKCKHRKALVSPDNSIKRLKAKTTPQTRLHILEINIWFCRSLLMLRNVKEQLSDKRSRLSRVHGSPHNKSPELLLIYCSPLGGLNV